MSEFHWRLQDLKAQLHRAKQRKFFATLFLGVAAMFVYVQLGFWPFLSILTLFAANDVWDIMSDAQTKLEKMVKQAQAITDEMTLPGYQRPPEMTEGDRWTRGVAVLETKED